MIFLRKRQDLFNPHVYFQIKLRDRIWEFYEWAFGDDFNIHLPMAEILDLWNKKHPEATFCEYDLLKESCAIMHLLWKDSLET